MKVYPSKNILFCGVEFDNSKQLDSIINMEHLKEKKLGQNQLNKFYPFHIAESPLINKTKITKTQGELSKDILGHKNIQTFSF